jgi:ATP-dependent DNA helicase RecQ
VCLGRLPEPLTAEPSPDTVRAVSLLLRGETHVLEPRKMWPGGAFGSRGKIPAGLMAEPGRAIVYADAPEWRETVRQVFAGDAPAPGDLRSAAVDTLTKWRATWVSRPEVVVALPAAGFEDLTASVADHLASVGRLDRADLALQDPPGDVSSLSSAEEAAAWRSAIRPSQDVTGRTVLLVVDATSSLWPVTVASAHLREAGATAVLPLVIHRRP